MLVTSEWAGGMKMPVDSLKGWSSWLLSCLNGEGLVFTVCPLGGMEVLLALCWACGWSAAGAHSVASMLQ